MVFIRNSPLLSLKKISDRQIEQSTRLEHTNLCSMHHIVKPVGKVEKLHGENSSALFSL